MRDDTMQGAAEADDKEILVEALAVAHKNVGGKFKALAQFSNLLQCELPLPREEHGDRTLRSEFRSRCVRS